MRLFFALPLPEELRTSMGNWQREARAIGLAAAYPRPEGLHLTLVFLGAVETEQLPALAAAAASMASRHAPMDLQTAKLGWFPPHGQPRVIWLGLQPSLPLRALQRALAEAMEPLGFPLEDRPYSPHLTLARPKGKADLERLPEVEQPWAWTVAELVLYESLPSSAGQRYERRAAWPLSGSPPLR